MNIQLAVFIYCVMVGLVVAPALGILYLNDQRKRWLTARALRAGATPKASWNTDEAFWPPGSLTVGFKIHIAGLVAFVLTTMGVAHIRWILGFAVLCIPSAILYIIFINIHRFDRAVRRAAKLKGEGNLDEALVSLRAAIYEKPTSGRWNALGEVFLANGRPNKALIAFREAERMQGPRPQPIVLVNMGLALCALGRVDEALASVDHARRLKPGTLTLTIAFFRCLILTRLGRADEATEELQRVEQLYRPMAKRLAHSAFAKLLDECRMRLKSMKGAIDYDLLS